MDYKKLQIDYTKAKSVHCIAHNSTKKGHFL